MTYMQMAEHTVIVRVEEEPPSERPIGPLHAWANGTATVLCGRPVQPRWTAVFEDFPPAGCDACPACLAAFEMPE